MTVRPSPGSYFSSIELDFPVSMGGYEYPKDSRPALRAAYAARPCSPGLPVREQQRAGRPNCSPPLSKHSSATFAISSAALLPGGFDPARDIQSITVNRWPHGYAYEYNSLFEPLDRPDSERPCVIGRQPFVLRIPYCEFWVSEDGHAYTNIAIDQKGHRAVRLDQRG